MMKPSNDAGTSHLPILDCLRGLAAMAVCLFHFSTGIGNRELLAVGDPIRQIGEYGWLGVDAFFVISGFVIPYSLHRSNYTYRDAVGFFARRLKRLEPPYLACIVLVIAIRYVATRSPHYQGERFSFDWPQVLAHLGYANAVLGQRWLNPVFWTLAIEFQYYILMAIVFPFIVHERLHIRSLAVLAIAMLGWMGINGAANEIGPHDNNPLLPHWLPLFAVGMVTFQYYVGKLSRGWYAVLLSLVSTVSLAVIGIEQTVVGVFAALTILIAGHRQPLRVLSPLVYLGTISYSLYLVHVPVGGKVVNLAMRLPDSIVVRYAALLAAFAVTLAFAFVFWWLIERTSQRWAKSSSRIRQSQQSAADG